MGDLEPRPKGLNRVAVQEIMQASKRAPAIIPGKQHGNRRMPFPGPGALLKLGGSAGNPHEHGKYRKQARQRRNLVPGVRNIGKRKNAQ